MQYALLGSSPIPKARLRRLRKVPFMSHRLRVQSGFAMLFVGLVFEASFSLAKDNPASFVRQVKSSFVGCWQRFNHAREADAICFFPKGKLEIRIENSASQHRSGSWDYGVENIVVFRSFEASASWCYFSFQSKSLILSRCSMHVLNGAWNKR